MHNRLCIQRSVPVMWVVHPHVAGYCLEMALTSDSRSHVRLPVMLFKVVVASDCDSKNSWVEYLICDSLTSFTGTVFVFYRKAYCVM